MAERPSSETTAPCWAKAFAMDEPMTPVAPTTTQCLPANCKAMVFCVVVVVFSVANGHGTNNVCFGAALENSVGPCRED